MQSVSGPTDLGDGPKSALEVTSETEPSELSDCHGATAMTYNPAAGSLR